MMNIDIENLVDIISISLVDKGYDIYSDETVERLNALEERVKKSPYFSKRFKVQLINELAIAVDSASLLHWNLLKMVYVLVLVCLKIC